MDNERAPSPDQDCTRALVHRPSPRIVADVPAGYATLDDFEILREIGRGGTAIVYEACQSSLGRNVALKRLPLGAAFDRRWLERFHGEVRTAAQLNHANIVPFYEQGQDRDSHFYTMQLVDGISLAEVVKRLRQCRASEDVGSRPCMNRQAYRVHPAFLRLCERCRCRFANCEALPVEKLGTDCTAERELLIANPRYHRAVAEVALDAARALDYAHQQGILHLDVKPSNLLIDGSGKLWMTDFGASPPQAGDGPSAEGAMGTLCYMSPEQAVPQDEQLDCRSDVYSLGATLYELLTLEPPFAHESPPALLSQVAAGISKPPRYINNSVPSELNSIVVRAMAVQPDRRFASAGEMANALEVYLSKSDEVPMPERKTRRRNGTFVSVLTITALACLALFAIPPSKVNFCHSFVKWNGHLYALTTGPTDWVSAEAEAVARGGHLITINDAVEQDFVVRQFLSPPDHVFWIGMTDRKKEGDWQWISGQPVTYSNWHPPREPNNFQHQHPVTGASLDEDYGVINWHLIFEPSRGRKGTWNDFLSIQDDRVVFYSFCGIIEIDSPTQD